MNKSQAYSIIATNARLFTPGNTFSQTDLCRLANIDMPTFGGIGALAITRRAQKFQLQKTSAYCALNRILRPTGVVIRQKGTNYHVTTLDESTAVVASYTRRAATLTRNVGILSTGIQSHLQFRGISE